jgi:riboflavin biosynthesis pyrimidine reductase
MGGGELARSFLQADLVDELMMHVVPILLGDGIRYSRRLPAARFQAAGVQDLRE